MESDYVIDYNIYKKDDFIFYDDERLLEETPINCTEEEYLWDRNS